MARLPIAIALLLAACGAASPPLPPDAAILPGTTVAQMLRQCSRQAPAPGEAAWLPSAEDVLALEAALPAALRPRPELREMHYPGDPDWARAPDGWRRQYVGIVRGGRRFIYGNFLPKRPEEGVEFGAADWRSVPIPVCDGGPVFFGVEYDVDAGRFTQIAFNGGLG